VLIFNGVLIDYKIERRQAIGLVSDY